MTTVLQEFAVLRYVHTGVAGPAGVSTRHAGKWSAQAVYTLQGIQRNENALNRFIHSS